METNVKSDQSGPWPLCETDENKLIIQKNILKII